MFCGTNCTKPHGKVQNLPVYFYNSSINELEGSLLSMSHPAFPFPFASISETQISQAHLTKRTPNISETLESDGSH